jgi:hypothetical protein
MRLYEELRPGTHMLFFPDEIASTEFLLTHMYVLRHSEALPPWGDGRCFWEAPDAAHEAVQEGAYLRLRRAP